MAVAQPRVICSEYDKRSVRNDEATAMLKGHAVKRGTAQDGVLWLDADTDALLGIVMEDIAAGAFGTVQTGGQAAVMAGGAITIGALIEPGTAGKCIAWAAAGGTNTSQVGVANSAAADTELFECELAGPASIKQG